MLTKATAAKLRGDFIPGGKMVDINILRFRRTNDTEVFRCCRQTQNDLQSGPIFCGDIAEFIARTADGIAALCERHAPPKHLVD